MPLEPIVERDPQLDASRHGSVIFWMANEEGQEISIAADSTALIAIEPHATDPLLDDQQLLVFERQRRMIERLASAKYDAGVVQSDGGIIIYGSDVPSSAV